MTGCCYALVLTAKQSTTCGYVNVSDTGQAGAAPNEFIVRTHDLGSGCPEVDMDFMFKVTGR